MPPPSWISWQPSSTAWKWTTGWNRPKPSRAARFEVPPSDVGVPPSGGRGNRLKAVLQHQKGNVQLRRSAGGNGHGQGNESPEFRPRRRGRDGGLGGGGGPRCRRNPQAPTRPQEASA